MTDVAASLRSSPTQRRSRGEALAKSKLTNEELAEELFLATLSRLPSADQKRAERPRKRSEGPRRPAPRASPMCFGALVNTREFILNH